MPADDDALPAPTASGPDAPSPLARARRLAGRSPAPPRPPASGRVGGRVPMRAGPGDESLAAPAAEATPGLAPSATPPARPAATPGPRRPRAGRNLPAAIGVGLGLGAVVVGSLFVSLTGFAVFVGLVMVYGCWELGHALAEGGIRISVAPIMVGGVAMLVATWERGPSGLMVAVSATLVGIFVWRVADGATGYARDATASAFVLLYLPTLAGFAVLLAHAPDGAGRELAFVATVVCSDTGGYAAGVLFGRHPLAPVVSKAKTWEGFAGSLAACATAGICFLALTFHEVWWKGLLFGLAIAVTATVGDLGESLIKRDLGIKDMGRLLPGHGGLMDRLDSLLPCAAVAYLLLQAFAPQ